MTWKDQVTIALKRPTKNLLSAVRNHPDLNEEMKGSWDVFLRGLLKEVLGEKEFYELSNSEKDNFLEEEDEKEEEEDYFA